MGSLLVVLDGWMSLCRADPNVSGYHLNGFWKGKPATIRAYAVVACFTGMVTEGAGEPSSVFGASLMIKQMCGSL